MATYVYVENGQIVEMHDSLPECWRNVSNFYATTVEERKQLGWFNVTKDIPPEFNPPETQLSDPTYTITADAVIESYTLTNIWQ